MIKLFEFLFDKKRADSRKIIIEVARKEVELLKEIDKICAKELNERKNKVSIERNDISSKKSKGNSIFLFG